MGSRGIGPVLLDDGLGWPAERGCSGSAGPCALTPSCLPAFVPVLPLRCSGTLSFIFNNLSHEKPFSEVRLQCPSRCPPCSQCMPLGPPQCWCSPCPRCMALAQALPGSPWPGLAGGSAPAASLPLLKGLPAPSPLPPRAAAAAAASRRSAAHSGGATRSQIPGTTSQVTPRGDW